ncbi:Hypothetical protein GOX1259 [Gluconobacter oxydans 621H]|uniref:Uncharacterized protein n=1 Tax=Gluconobacter oxydans (strain 621H) TaxID=290633 RepID=Q5FRH6_GLUOX|nr:Hypothetical protein GOX1259 [Gluconobacter oxydans 621H]
MLALLATTGDQLGRERIRSGVSRGRRVIHIGLAIIIVEEGLAVSRRRIDAEGCIVATHRLLDGDGAQSVIATDSHVHAHRAVSGLLDGGDVADSGGPLIAEGIRSHGTLDDRLLGTTGEKQGYGKCRTQGNGRTSQTHGQLQRIVTGHAAFSRRTDVRM